MGPEQAQAFKRYGVAPNRCLIGHCCANSDLRYQKAILDEGVYVGFDRFGNSWHGDDYFRMATLAALIHMGFSNRLFIGTDSVAFLLKALPGNRDYRYWDPVRLFDVIIPELKQRGATEQDIRNLTRDNAKRFFSGEAIL